jgi:hypothetical protein
MGSHARKKPVPSLEIEPIHLIGEFIDDANDQISMRLPERQGSSRKIRPAKHKEKRKQRFSK